MTSYIEPLAQESTPSIIAEKLRKAIAHGELKPGAQLGEAELARQLGVSRGPLREGMQRLTQEGLLVSIRNRGLFVIDMTVGEIRDMYLARAAIERAAASKIVADGNHEAAGKELLTLVRKMSDAEGDPAAVGEIDIAFHELLVHLAASPRLTRIHKTLITETRMCIQALESTCTATEARVGEHQHIAEAIAAGDHLLADDLLVAHMDDAISRLTTH